MTIAGDLPETLEDWWSDFARSLRRRNRSEKTIKLYRRSYERFWRWAIDNDTHPDPAEVTAATINRWTDQIRTEVAPATVAIYWRNLRPFFSWWADQEEQPNPFTRADTPSVEENPPDVIHLDDVRALLATCKGSSFDDLRDNAIIRILFDTGARRGEMNVLTLDDWDRRRDFLTLNGKTGIRVVPISPSTGEALARYARKRDKHPAAATTNQMWLGRKGPLGDSGISQLLARRSEQAGLPRLHPHAFRHTFSHEFRAQGGSDVDLMYLCGWTSTAMAARYGKSAAAERARATHRRLGLGDKL